MLGGGWFRDFGKGSIDGERTQFGSANEEAFKTFFMLGFQARVRNAFTGRRNSYSGRPTTAKNRGEPQKMTPSSETEIFFGVVPMGKL